MDRGEGGLGGFMLEFCIEVDRGEGGFVKKLDFFHYNSSKKFLTYQQ
jgi:hypothetical protein